MTVFRVVVIGGAIAILVLTWLVSEAIERGYL